MTWKEPPQVPRRSGGRARITVWPQRLEPVMKKRGEWARFGPFRMGYAGTAAYALRSGRLSSPPGRWEFAGRIEGEESFVYARYLGPDEALS